MLPILAEAGLQVGQDYFLAYSPEREDPGNADYSANRIPKVIGGYNEESLQLASLMYGTAVASTVPVSSLEVAEACKILENTYRSVNIALVNELKMLFDRMASTSGKSSTRPRPSPSASRPSIPDRVWAGTASRSIRST